jgi:hypothetical protein
MRKLLHLILEQCVGVLEKQNTRQFDELSKEFEKSVGHKISLYNYGSKKIKDQRVL